ncbi:tRNA (adenosine(37)-N6)-threonylcarbamoyltransferase complex transferase subunit TsaD [Candidatus Roizmanbacteria bacterium]|nr:tRNA (adenosine(37)-N6)-threonylcarbamoyltransferase complex transferase subunit TsaD [Candidatus Roizmanbacteria bacterium]
MKILSIDTSCDETAAAVVEGRRVLSNVIYSQILIHKKWGGVVPSLAKRAHEERIDLVIDEALKKNKIDYIAVTQGPGLAVALEVGIKKAKELAEKYDKKLISVNHLEGHIYSPFVQNSRGNPVREFHFPYLALVISGGHTEFVIFKNHLDYEIIGATLDDAAGEAIDKAAKLLNLGYPGGPVIEKLAGDVKNIDSYRFPRPMLKSNDLNFSFSGLKTSFYYFLKKNHNEPIKELASSFQEAVFDTIIKKTEKAIKKSGINRLIVGGGVIANLRLRQLFRNLTNQYQGEVLFPAYKYLSGDNAAMIGVVASYKAERKIFVENEEELDRIPRFSL